MTLADFIRANPDATDEEILSARNAKSVHNPVGLVPFSPEQIDALKSVGAIEEKHADDLAKIGVEVLSPHEIDAGKGAELTKEQIAEARESINRETQRRETEAWAAEWLNEIVYPAIAEGKSRDEIKADLIKEWS